MVTGSGGIARCRRERDAASGFVHQVADPGCDVLAEPAHVVDVVGAEDERAHAVVEGQRRQLLGPVLGGPRQATSSGPTEGAGDVVEAADRGRVASGVGGGLVDGIVEVRQRFRIGVAHARQPAVRIPAGQSQHPRFVGADPDLDGVGRSRARVQSVDVVVLAVDADRGAACPPDTADDLDALPERVDALRRGEPGAAGRHDRVPEPSGAQAEVHPPAGDEVQGRDALGEDDGRAQRQVGDVERDPERGAARRDDREQGPGVGVAGLVRMVLDADEVETTDLGHLGEQQHPVEVGRVRRGEQPEPQLLPVVHGLTLRGAGSRPASGLLG